MSGRRTRSGVIEIEFGSGSRVRVDHRGGAPHRRAVCDRAVDRRQEPLVDDLKACMREQAAKLSRGHNLVKAIHYLLKRWNAFMLFLDDGRVCMSNNAAERGLRCVALGRKSWLFCGPTAGAGAPQTCTA